MLGNQGSAKGTKTAQETRLWSISEHAWLEPNLILSKSTHFFTLVYVRTCLMATANSVYLCTCICMYIYIMQELIDQS